MRIADAVGYVGACTVELMFKNGHFFLLEMNTRIQVEHPVTEEAHRIRPGEELEPLNLVPLQLAIANGEPLAFAQDHREHARGARVPHQRRVVEAEHQGLARRQAGPVRAQRGLVRHHRGARDGRHLAKLKEAGSTGIVDLTVRFDCGFEAGDKLVNKDPTFGKLIISVAAEEHAYELLRLACIEVLAQMRIEGRQVRPDGVALDGKPASRPTWPTTYASSRCR